MCPPGIGRGFVSKDVCRADTTTPRTHGTERRGVLNEPVLFPSLGEGGRGAYTGDFSPCTGSAVAQAARHKELGGRRSRDPGPGDCGGRP